MPARLLFLLLVLSLCACSRGEKPAQPPAAAHDNTVTPTQRLAQDTTKIAPPTAQDTSALAQAATQDTTTTIMPVAQDTAAPVQSEITEIQGETSAPVLPDSAYVKLKISEAGRPEEYLRLLRPGAFPQLPQNVSVWLTDNEYLIVQSDESSRPHNVLSGEYVRPGQKDWAVLAYKDSTISIIVFWNEDGQGKHAMVEINLCKDRIDFLINARALETVPVSYLQKYTDWSDSLPVEAVVNHEAVGRVERDCYYHYDGEWYRATIYGRNTRDVKKEGILRLPASEFPQLPAGIARWLDSHGYTITQSFVSRKPHNVLSGEFRKTGQTDWVVLASKNNFSSSVIVFWNGSVNNAKFLSLRTDSWAFGEVELDSSTYIYTYRRFIEIIKPDELQMFRSDTTCWYNDTVPPSISRCAVKDSFGPYEENIYYWHEGKLYIADRGD